MCDQIKANPKTKQLAILYVDLYLRNSPIPNEKLQLAAIAAILIAIKVTFALIQTEESFLYTIDSAIYHTGNQYTAPELEQMELQILNNLKWRVNLPVAGDYAATYLLLLEDCVEENAISQLNCIIEYYIASTI